MKNFSFKSFNFKDLTRKQLIIRGSIALLFVAGLIQYIQEQRIGQSFGDKYSQIGYDYTGPQGAFTGQGEQPGQFGGAGQADGMQTHQIMDPQRNMVAITASFPAGWQVQSRLSWIQGTGLPFCQLRCQAQNPQSGEVIEIFPDQKFNFFDGPTSRSLQGYSGGTQSVAPMEPVQAVQSRIVGPMRGQQPGFRIVSAGLVDPSQDPSAAGSNGRKARVQISYQENGRPVEEVFYARITVNQNQVGQDVIGNWTIDGTCSYRTQAGQLEQGLPMFQQVVASFQANPQWVQSVSGAQQTAFNNVQGQRRADAQFGQQMADFRAQQGANQQDLYNQRWASSERQLNDFGNLMTNQRDIVNPHNGYQIKVDNNPRYDWVDRQNNVFQTNSPMDNPNQYMNGDWTQTE